MDARSRSAATAMVLVALVALALVATLLSSGEDDPRDAREPPEPAGELRPSPQTPAPVELEPGATPVAAPPPVAPDATPPLAPPTSGPEPVDPDPPPALRGVRGVVRDAATKRPIAGAWVAWRRPDQDVILRVLGQATLADDATLTMLTDAEGRFDVARLPDDEDPQCTLFAVATGYAVGSTVPGLVEDVAIELGPMGVLEVEMRGPLEPMARIEVREPRAGDAEMGPNTMVAGATLPTDEVVFASTFTGRPRWRIPHLAPGDYDIAVDGKRTRAHVEAGQTTTVLVERVAPVLVRGALRDASGAPAQADTLSFTSGADTIHPGDDESNDGTDDAGRFEVRLPPGRWQATAWLDHDQTQLACGAFDVTSPAEVELRLPARRPVVVRLTGDTSGAVGLLSPDGPRVILQPRGAGEHAGEAPPGRYLVFVDDVLAGEVQVAEDGPPPPAVELSAQRTVLLLRWRLPDALRAGEVLRAWLAVVPQAVAASSLRDEYVRGTRRRVKLERGEACDIAVAPGPVTVIVDSDLGRTVLEAVVSDEQPRVELEVTIGP